MCLQSETLTKELLEGTQKIKISPEEGSYLQYSKEGLLIIPVGEPSLKGKAIYTTTKCSAHCADVVCCHVLFTT